MDNINVPTNGNLKSTSPVPTPSLSVVALDSMPPFPAEQTFKPPLQYMEGLGTRHSLQNAAGGVHSFSAPDRFYITYPPNFSRMRALYNQSQYSHLDMARTNWHTQGSFSLRVLLT